MIIPEPPRCDFCDTKITGVVYRHGKPEYPRYRKWWCGRCRCWCGVARSARKAWETREAA